MSGLKDLTSVLVIRTATASFLEKFCIRDSKDISELTHKHMMLAHFYYVDKVEDQGWYVLDDPDMFHRDLTDDEYWIYGTLYENCEAFE